MLAAAGILARPSYKPAITLIRRQSSDCMASLHRRMRQVAPAASQCRNIAAFVTTELPRSSIASRLLLRPTRAQPPAALQAIARVPLPSGCHAMRKAR